MMRDLNKIFMECLEEVKNAGIEPGKIVRVSINNRMVKKWGQCKRNNGQYYIEISSLFLDEKNSIDGLKNTIIHEILHTCKNSFDHKQKWKEYAKIMNLKYGYNIKRTSTAEEKGIMKESLPEAKYQLICEKCGHIYNHYRMCKAIKNPEYYGCGICNGNLKRIK